MYTILMFSVVILDEIGFKPFFDRLTTEYMVPFTTILFPTYCGATLDAHHAFIVRDSMHIIIRSLLIVHEIGTI